MAPRRVPDSRTHSPRTIPRLCASRATAHGLSSRPSRLSLASSAVKGFCVLLAVFAQVTLLQETPNQNLKVVRFPDKNSAEISDRGKTSTILLADPRQARRSRIRGSRFGLPSDSENPHLQLRRHQRHHGQGRIRLRRPQPSPEEETITIPPNAGGTIKIVAEYQ